jgi:hypothetical protein
MNKPLLVLLAVALVLLGALLPLVMPRFCPVNRVACENIKDGMTQAEVYAILGGPPGDYRTQPPAPPSGLFTLHRGLLRHARRERWQGNEGTAIVLFSMEPGSAGPMRVSRVSFDEAKPYAPGLVELARWRLRRLKERLLP